MKIGLLGSAFNPPHLGHALMARQALDFGGFDEVWFLPNYGQEPPKEGIAPVFDRVKMVQLDVLERTRVSTIEIDHKLSGNTIELLPFLPKNHTFEFIVGSDWLPHLHTWSRFEELISQLPFLVIPRAGYPVTPLYPHHMRVLSNPLLITTDISATKIRGRASLGLSLRGLVSDAVAQYITTRGLYQNQTERRGV